MDGANFLSILAFDSRSLAYMLDDSFSEFFSSEYPLIYKNKIRKVKKSDNSVKTDNFFYRSAIDNAMKNNQVRAMDVLIAYIAKYQGNYVSSYLFSHCLNRIIEQGISIQPLLRNPIFRFEFAFDEWPSLSKSNEKLSRGYNESIFDIRYNFKRVFPECRYKYADHGHGGVRTKSVDFSGVYKINYSINLLPSFGEYVKQDSDG